MTGSAKLNTFKKAGDSLAGRYFEYQLMPLDLKELREDLQTDDKSVKRWLTWLENSCALFKISPFSKNLKYSQRKASKYYLFDYPLIKEPGARLENPVALAIHKELLLRNDRDGENCSLHYLQDKFHHEIDFLICNDMKPILMIEVKTSDKDASKNFAWLSKLDFD